MRSVKIFLSDLKIKFVSIYSGSSPCRKSGPWPLFGKNPDSAHGDFH
jgi:hypothetical protein